MRVLGKRGTWIVSGIALLLLAIVVFLGFLSFTGTENAIIDEFQERQALAANRTAEGIEAHFESLARETRALATSRIVQRFNKQAVEREIGLELDELGELGVIDIRILDANGIVKFSASGPKTEGRDFSSRDYFKEARRATSSKQVFIELVRLPEPGNKMTVVIASPIFAPRSAQDRRSTADRFAGIAMVNMDIDTVINRFVVPKESAPTSHAKGLSPKLHRLESANCSKEETI